jgi:hypothetical protein
MKTTRLALGSRAAAAIAIALLCAGSAWAADPAPTAASKTPSSAQKAPPSKEARAQMAALHEQMAACLRSDKSITDCRTEVMKSCRDTMGTQGCPYMGMGQRGMGMGSGMGGGMMQTPPPKSAK